MSRFADSHSSISLLVGILGGRRVGVALANRLSRFYHRDDQLFHPVGCRGGRLPDQGRYPPEEELKVFREWHFWAEVPAAKGLSKGPDIESLAHHRNIPEPTILQCLLYALLPSLIAFSAAGRGRGFPMLSALPTRGDEGKGGGVIS